MTRRVRNKTATQQSHPPAGPGRLTRHIGPGTHTGGSRGHLGPPRPPPPPKKKSEVAHLAKKRSIGVIFSTALDDFYMCCNKSLTLPEILLLRFFHFFLERWTARGATWASRWQQVVSFYDQNFKIFFGISKSSKIECLQVYKSLIFSKANFGFSQKNSGLIL